MRGHKRIRKLIRGISHFFVFFLLVAFVVTCCQMLFISVLQRSMEITFTKQDISVAAKLTMINVVIISTVFFAVDGLRRKFTVERPVKKITEAADKMIAGDFSVRIKPVARFATDDSFNEIIECINKMSKELSGVEALRTDFIANVSHEMKTPLSAIHNYGTLLQLSEISDEKRIEYAKAMTDASKRLSDMMTNILKLNRLENQSIYPEKEIYNLSEQLCECLLQYENVWEDKEIDINTDIEENVTVAADGELLYLVWNNLFSNAFKFTEKGGKVFVSLSTEDGYATVRVRDTGCGIPPEEGTHIFEKFYQGDTSHTTEGNGLGLALVKRVVDIVQGKITVESTVGVGTTFAVMVRRDTNEVE